MAAQLGVWDYAVFGLTILITIVIGGCRIYKDHNKNTEFGYFLLAHRTSGLFPIVLSSIATLVSGVGLLAVPAEAYVAGIVAINFTIFTIFPSIVAALVYIPVYYKLNVTSVMEYIELRFNRALKIIAVICYFTAQLMNSSIILHLPALAINQVTGIGTWTSMAPMTLICTLYTALGGFNAVLWTDVFQALLMLATTMFLAIKGLMDIGGFGVLAERLSEGNRTTLLYWSPGPTVRYTIWTNLFGSFAIRLLQLSDQAMVQRQLASKTLKSAKLSIFGGFVGILITSAFSVLLGLIIYARYYDCDPVLSGEITSRDQLAPYFAMDILRSLPGAAGFFIAGIVAASLSTLSSSINSLSLIAMQDFVKPFYRNLGDARATKLTKILNVGIGLTILLLVLIFENFSSAFVAMNAARGITGGPLLGLTTLGMLVPFASNVGSAAGCIAGSAIATWIILGSVVSKYIHPYATVTDSQCNTTLGFNSTFPISPAPYLEHNESISPLYQISFQWFVCIGFCTTVLVGIIASLVTGPRKVDGLPQDVIHPAADKLFRNLPDFIKSKLGYTIVKAVEGIDLSCIDKEF